MESSISTHPYFNNKAISSFFCIDQKPDLETEKALLELFNHIQMKEYGKGEVIFFEGDIGEVFYIIESGKVEVIKDSEGGFVITQLGEGDYFGELALLTSKPRSATIKASEQTQVYCLHQKDFYEITQVFPKVFGNIFRKLYDQLKDAYRVLDKKNKELEISSKERVELGFIFISTVVLVSLYSFVIQIFHSQLLQGTQATWINFVINRGIEVIALLIIISIILKSKLSCLILE